jgi:hypothetical protein
MHRAGAFWFVVCFISTDTPLATPGALACNALACNACSSQPVPPSPSPLALEGAVSLDQR